jgi:hypothetical protein
LRQGLPDVPHVACPDTAFHAELPAAAATYPLPPTGGPGGGCAGMASTVCPTPGPTAAPRSCWDGRSVISIWSSRTSAAAPRSARCGAGEAWTPRWASPRSTVCQ